MRRAFRLDKAFIIAHIDSYILFRDAFLAFLEPGLPLSFKNDVLDLLPYMLQLPPAYLEQVWMSRSLSWSRS
jgi:hypothetical protein